MGDESQMVEKIVMVSRREIKFSWVIKAPWKKQRFDLCLEERIRNWGEGIYKSTEVGNLRINVEHHM